MINYKSTAFCYSSPVGGRLVAGNPSSVFILEEGEEFSREKMSALGISENYPISCFVKKVSNSSREDYDIFFYNLDGSQAYMCGSGTMSTAFILNKLFNLPRINFYFDITPFKVEINNNVIVAKVENDNLVHLERRTHSFSPLAGWNEDMEAIVKSFQIDTSLVVEILRTVELNDLIFVLNNSITLRKMKPNFKEMAIILEKLDIRNLCATALGDQDKFDFETRIFIPHDNLNEDLACGSSSLAIASYWNKKIDKDNFTVLFPYHMEHPDGKIGGVQFIKILDDRTMVGGYCDSISQDSKTVNYTVQHSLLYSNLAN